MTKKHPKSLVSEWARNAEISFEEEILTER